MAHGSLNRRKSQGSKFIIVKKDWGEDTEHHWEFQALQEIISGEGGGMEEASHWIPFYKREI